MRRLVWPLDRYVFTEWTKIFFATALGFPILLVIIDVTDHLQTYLDRHIPRRQWRRVPTTKRHPQPPTDRVRQ